MQSLKLNNMWTTKTIKPLLEDIKFIVIDGELLITDTWMWTAPVSYIVEECEKEEISLETGLYEAMKAMIDKYGDYTKLANDEIIVKAGKLLDQYDNFMSEETLTNK